MHESQGLWIEVEHTRSQVEATAIPLARTAYQESRSVHMVTSLGGTIGVKTQMMCTTPYVLNQSGQRESVSALSRLVGLVYLWGVL